MKVLITGGAGFIGSNLTRYWCEKYPGDQVVVLDKLTYAGHKQNLSGLKIKFIHGDICDVTDVKSAMKNADVVIHLAAESHVDRSVIGPGVFMQTNVIGTQVLLQQALAEKVKLFHHVSTDEVFGELPLNSPRLKFDEHTPYAPHTPYSASKAASDHLVRAWHSTYGLPVTITNTSNNFGPYQDPEKLIPRFITNLLQNLKVPLMGRGENIRDWLYVTDHCRALDLIIHRALKNPRLIGETFCVGGDSQRSNLQITKELLALLKKDDTWIKLVKHRLGHDSRYAINSSKIRRILGWKPQYKFEDWLPKTVDWYINNSWWWKPLKENRPLIDPAIQIKLAHHSTKK